MNYKKKLSISLQEEQFSQVEKIIFDLCQKYRMYDEYYGTISRAADIVLSRINSQNSNYSDDIEIVFVYKGRNLEITIEGNANCNAMFDTNSDEQDMETLRLLISDIAFPDTNQVTVSFSLDSLHQKEWVRRNSLVNKYFYKTRKHV